MRLPVQESVLHGVIVGLPEVEYPEISNVWVHTRREAPFRAALKAPETVAEGPGAQPEGTRGTS